VARRCVSDGGRYLHGLLRWFRRGACSRATVPLRITPAHGPSHCQPRAFCVSNLLAERRPLRAPWSVLSRARPASPPMPPSLAMPIECGQLEGRPLATNAPARLQGADRSGPLCCLFDSRRCGLQEIELTHRPAFAWMKAFIRSASSVRRNFKNSRYWSVAHRVESVGTHWLLSASACWRRPKTEPQMRVVPTQN
jgi:hypothetical protein